MIAQLLEQKQPYFAPVTEPKQLKGFAEKLSTRWSWDERAVLADAVRQTINVDLSAKDILGAGIFSEIDGQRIYIFWLQEEKMVCWWFDRSYIREQIRIVRRHHNAPFVESNTPQMMASVYNGDLDSEGIPVSVEVLPKDVADNLVRWGWVILNTWEPVDNQAHELSSW